jgi:hypothetical protein
MAMLWLTLPMSHVAMPWVFGSHPSVALNLLLILSLSGHAWILKDVPCDCLPAVIERLVQYYLRKPLWQGASGGSQTDFREERRSTGYLHTPVGGKGLRGPYVAGFWRASAASNGIVGGDLSLVGVTLEAACLHRPEESAWARVPRVDKGAEGRNGLGAAVAAADGQACSPVVWPPPVVQLPMARLEGWPAGGGGGDRVSAGVAPTLRLCRVSVKNPLRCPLAHGLVPGAQAGKRLGRQGGLPPSACSI